MNCRSRRHAGATENTGHQAGLHETPRAAQHLYLRISVSLCVAPSLFRRHFLGVRCRLQQSAVDKRETREVR